MKRIAFLSMLVTVVWTRVALAHVIFLPGNTQQGNGSGNGKGAVVCVQQGVGVVGCSPFEPTGNPGHSNTNQETNAWYVSDDGGWLYHGDSLDPSFGQVQVNCSHPDSKGVAWLNY